MPTNDPDRTVAFYQSLGFVLHARHDSDYLVFAQNGVELHFAHDPEHVAETSDHAVYFHSDDVDTLSGAMAKLNWVAQGYPRFAPAQDRPWGMRELHVLDPDGHLIRIGQEVT
nr:VOC family protein [Sulfitobacter aestuariivivens]